MCGYLLRSQLLTDFRRRGGAEYGLTTSSRELSDSGFIRNLGRSKIIRHIVIILDRNSVTDFAKWLFKDDVRLNEKQS